MKVWTFNFKIGSNFTRTGLFLLTSENHTIQRICGFLLKSVFPLQSYFLAPTSTAYQISLWKPLFNLNSSLFKKDLSSHFTNTYCTNYFLFQRIIQYSFTAQLALYSWYCIVGFSTLMVFSRSLIWVVFGKRDETSLYAKPTLCFRSSYTQLDYLLLQCNTQVWLSVACLSTWIYFRSTVVPFICFYTSVICYLYTHFSTIKGNQSFLKYFGSLVILNHWNAYIPWYL